MHTVSELTQVSSNLKGGDLSFAQSLISKADRGLSEKQLYWVDQLFIRATTPAAVEVSRPTHQFDAAPLQALFNVAGQNLKFPKVRLQTSNGNPIAISRAGDLSRYPGSLNITDGGSYGENIWYGRINLGVWEESSSVTDEVRDIVKVLTIDPIGVATEYGKLTGSCTFCGKALSDEKSTAVGYGKTCAKNYGLKWGEK